MSLDNQINQFHMVFIICLIKNWVNIKVNDNIQGLFIWINTVRNLALETRKSPEEEDKLTSALIFIS